MWRAGLLALAACGRLDFAGLPDCPDGFVGIAGNTALGTHSFCVMQFEARGNVQEWVDWTLAGIYALNMNRFTTQSFRRDRLPLRAAALTRGAT